MGGKSGERGWLEGGMEGRSMSQKVPMKSKATPNLAITSSFIAITIIHNPLFLSHIYVHFEHTLVVILQAIERIPYLLPIRLYPPLQLVQPLHDRI